MPYKAKEKHRHKIPKAHCRVKNWRDYDAALRRRGDLTVWVTPAAMAAVIIPPRSTAVPSTNAKTAPTQRDRHLQVIEERGRLGWQEVNYGRRSLGEVAMMRYKGLIGRRLHARTLPTQKTEVAVGCKVINIMTQLGMPASQRLA